jgi:hypothetical protein
MTTILNLAPRQLPVGTKVVFRAGGCNVLTIVVSAKLYYVLQEKSGAQFTVMHHEVRAA